MKNLVEKSLKQAKTEVLNNLEEQTGLSRGYINKCIFWNKRFNGQNTWLTGIMRKNSSRFSDLDFSRQYDAFMH